jgi:hypothetical protein
MTRTPSWPLAELMTLGMTSWMVVAMRSARLATAPQPLAGQDRREVERMVVEKLEAVVESNLAIMRFALRAQAAFLVATLGGRPQTAFESAQRAGEDLGRLMTVGLAPYHRRAGANARRLSR